MTLQVKLLTQCPSEVKVDKHSRPVFCSCLAPQWEHNVHLRRIILLHPVNQVVQLDFPYSENKPHSLSPMPPSGVNDQFRLPL